MWLLTFIICIYECWNHIQWVCSARFNTKRPVRDYRPLCIRHLKFHYYGIACCEWIWAWLYIDCINVCTWRVVESIWDICLQGKCDDIALCVNRFRVIAVPPPFCCMGGLWAWNMRRWVLWIVSCCDLKNIICIYNYNMYWECRYSPDGL